MAGDGHTVGLPAEVKDHEERVALTPSAVAAAVDRGHRVLVQAGAGAGAGFPDDDYAAAGASNVTFHVEATEDPRGVVKILHDAGCKAGISLKPGTPVADVLPFLEVIDLVLVMSVEPGFGGQKFMPHMLDKVRSLRAANVLRLNPSEMQKSMHGSRA